jgi:hypothetical protein
MAGKTHSAETRLKISKGNLGKTIPIEIRIKTSITMGTAIFVYNSNDKTL